MKVLYTVFLQLKKKIKYKLEAIILKRVTWKKQDYKTQIVM